MEHKLRDTLLAPYSEQSGFGGVRYFRGLPLKVLQQMIDHRFVELGPWNDCPGVAALFLPFLKAHPTFTAHGYAVSPDRPDCHVTVEGVEKVGRLTTEEAVDITNAFRGADELQITSDYARCRYD